MNPTHRDNCRLWLLIWASFLLFVFLRNGLPGISEPHYVGKARHFADPTWCRGDLFMESANAHAVFYAVQGPLTRLVSPDLSIVLGRALALGILACGWVALGQSATGDRRATLWSAWFFLGLAAAGNLSGEWVVGTVESKVYSYGFALLGIAATLRDRWRRSALMLGLAISFHPIVGGWTTLCLAAALVAEKAPRLPLMFRRTSGDSPDSGVRFQIDSRPSETTLAAQPAQLPTGGDPAGSACSLSPREFASCCLIGLLASLPGLIPVLPVILGVPPEINHDATYIQVFGRLNHHLDPMMIPRSAFLMYGLLFVAGLALSFFCLPRESGRWLRRFTIAAVLIALLGLAAGWHPQRRSGAAPFEMPHYEFVMSFLKYYPFRMADTWVPLLAALSAAAGLSQLATRWSGWGDGRNSTFEIAEKSESAAHSKTTSRPALAALASMYVLAAAPLVWSIATPDPDQKNPSRMPPEQFAEWVTTCRWVAANVPAESEFITFSDAWGFKWFAERPEYVAYKDCPQDAAGLVEWNRRILVLADWWRQAEREGISPKSTRRLARRTNATHLITSTMELPWLDQLHPPADQAPLKGTPQYRVYRLAP